MGNPEAASEAQAILDGEIPVLDRAPEGFVPLDPPLTYGAALKAIAGLNPGTFETHSDGTPDLMGDGTNVTVRMGDSKREGNNGKVVAYKVD